MKKIFTLCVIIKDSKILLGMKKRGFGEGMWNGFGGKVLEGESIKDAAVRELEEEAGIIPADLVEVGVLDFSFESDPKLLEVHIFKITDFKGEPKESEEMTPQWFAIENIPYDKMWADDIHWLPLLLSGKNFKGKFLFDRPSDPTYSAKILKQELVEIK